MNRKCALLIVAAGLCLISSAHAATIIWVSDNKTPAANVPADQGWVDLLTAQGYTVDLSFRNKEGRTLDDTKIAALNAADLIIISRDTDSGNYDDGTEPAQWNAVTTPILMQIAHIARNNRWLWLDTGATNDSQPTLQAVISSHPVFNGVALDANNQVSVLTTNSSFASITDAGNGTLIATRVDNGQVWIAEWQPGQPFYASSTQSPAGHRMLLCSGGTAGVSDGTYNLSPDGEKIFLNAVGYMLGETGGPKTATRPDPKDASIVVGTWVTLGWTPGSFAATHDVYIGENFADVSAGTADTFRGNQAETSLFVGLGLPGDPYPAGLVPGTTYYWRIDEVNAAEPNSPWKGDVWSFSTAPRTAYNPKPGDEAQAVALNASLSWTGGYESKLHTVYFGESFDDVSNATAGGSVVATTTFNPGPLKAAKVYYWRVDETNPPNTYKGQVWSFTTVEAVKSPSPANGAGNAAMNAILTWTPGDDAASHQVYFGTDQEAVRKATAASPEYKGAKALGAESYDPGLLAWDSMYYWRIDEVNATNASSPWKGPVWSFTTGGSLIVDDIESYNDLPETDPGSNRVYTKWIDGYGTTTNGAFVGNLDVPLTQRTNVHGGAQAMPLSYDNNLKYSEATMTLSGSARDWTRQGVVNLSLWFRGVAANAPERMYVALNGSVVVYNDDTSLTQKTAWTQWVIPLSQFSGVNPANVTSITIGFGTRGSTGTAGGKGQMYFDDIRLYRPSTAQ